MIIPGGYVLLEIGVRLGLSVYGCSSAVIDSPWNYFIFFVAAYLTGLIVDSVASIVFLPLRNHPYPLTKFQKAIKTETECNCNVMCYGFAMLFITFVSVASPHCCIAKFLWFMTLPLFLGIAVYTKFVSSDYPGILEDYYDKYYYLKIKNRKDTIISRIEGQVAFLRNMFFSMLFFSLIDICICKDDKTLLFALLKITGNCQHEIMECAVCIYRIILPLTFAAMVARQNKVYYLVNTDYHFYSKLDTNDSNPNEITQKDNDNETKMS